MPILLAVYVIGVDKFPFIATLKRFLSSNFSTCMTVLCAALQWKHGIKLARELEQLNSISSSVTRNISIPPDIERRECHDT